MAAKYATLLHLSGLVSRKAYRDVEDYNVIFDLLASQYNRMEFKDNSEFAELNNEDTQTQADTEHVEDPPCVRTKGCGVVDTTATGKRRRIQTCSRYGRRGHNRRSCPNLRPMGDAGAGLCTSLVNEDLNTDYTLIGDYNSQLVSTNLLLFIFYVIYSDASISF